MRLLRVAARHHSMQRGPSRAELPFAYVSLHLSLVSEPWHVSQPKARAATLSACGALVIRHNIIVAAIVVSRHAARRAHRSIATREQTVHVTADTDTAVGAVGRKEGSPTDMASIAKAVANLFHLASPQPPQRRSSHASTQATYVLKLRPPTTCHHRITKVESGVAAPVLPLNRGERIPRSASEYEGRLAH